MRGTFIRRIMDECAWANPNDYTTLFRTSQFPDGVIDLEREASRKFFIGKTWREVDYVELASNHFYCGCLTNAGFKTYFPALLLAALSDAEGLIEQAIHLRVMKHDPLLVEIARIMDPLMQRVFFDILEMWANEQDRYFEERSIEVVKEFEIKVVTGAEV